MTAAPLPRPHQGRPRRARHGLALVAVAAALALTGCAASANGDGDGGVSGGVTATGAAGASGRTTGDSGTSCDLTGCTVTLQRGVDAKASVLGVEVALVAVTGDLATLRIAGQQVTVPLSGEGSAEVAGLAVTVRSADASRIVLRVTRP